MEMRPYIVYIKHDEEHRITVINSSAFLPDNSGLVEIDSGYGDKYHHAQGNYFPLPITDERGIYRYLYTPGGDTLWRERTQEEMDADWIEPEATPTADERLLVLEEENKYLKEILEIILSGETEASTDA